MNTHAEQAHVTSFYRERWESAEPNWIPPLPGTLIGQYVKCGKPNCKCTRGELHGPYQCHFWTDGETGKLKKRYVRLSDVEIARQMTNAHAERRARMMALKRQAEQIERGIREDHTTTQTLIRQCAEKRRAIRNAIRTADKKALRAEFWAKLGKSVKECFNELSWERNRAGRCHGGE